MTTLTPDQEQKLEEYRLNRTLRMKAGDAAFARADLPADLNPSQERAIQALFRYAAEAFHGPADEMEFKRAEVTRLEYDARRLEVLLEVGKVGDEGTLSSLYCRERGQFFVGQNGGLRYYDAKTTKRLSGWKTLYRAWG